MSNVKNAILKAKIEGIIYEVMVKTTAANVFVDDNTTLAAKLASIVADIATKASSEDLTNGLAGKADKVHTHGMTDVTGLDTELAKLATTEAMNAAIAALKQEMLGDTPVEAYNTFTELAQYIADHKEVSDALTEAIGTKADKTEVQAVQNAVNALGALAALDKVSESNLDDALREKVNAASEGNHSHNNKDVIDGITAQNITDWNDAVAKEHEHANKAVLDDISATKVAAWDAAETNAKTYAKEYADGLADNYDAAGSAATAESNAKAYAKEYADGLNTAMDGRVAAVEGKVASWDAKANIYYSASEPANLTENDLWVQLI